MLNGSGQLASVSISDARPRTITYTNDLAGQAIRRDEADANYAAGDPHEIWYRYDGRQLGMVGNNGTLETDYSRSIANRTQVAGSGAFRFEAAGMSHQAEFGPNLQPITSYHQGSAGLPQRACASAILVKTIPASIRPALPLGRLGDADLPALSDFAA